MRQFILCILFLIGTSECVFGAIRAFEKGLWRISINDATGAWTELSHNGKAIASQPSIPFSLEYHHGQQSEKTGELQLEQAEFKDATLTMTFRSGDWQFRQTVRFGVPDERCLELGQAVRYTGTNHDMRSGRIFFYLTMPCDGEYLNPGVFFNSTEGIWSNKHQTSGNGIPLFSRGALSALPKGIHLGVPHYVSCILARRSGADCLLIFRKPERESGGYQIDRPDDNAKFIVTCNCNGWASSNWETVDNVYLAAAAKSPDAMLREDVQQLFSATGQSYPSDRPQTAVNALIYGTLAPRFRLARFSDLANGEGNRLSALGFNTYWIPPVQEGTVQYYPIDFNTVDREHGSWNDYESMAKTLASSGVRLMQDVVPHGGYTTPLEYRIWHWNGATVGGRPADWRSDGWNRLMGEHAALNCRHGAGAFRVDSAAGSHGPNWLRPGFTRQQEVSFANLGQKQPPVSAIPATDYEAFLSRTNGGNIGLDYGRAGEACLGGAFRLNGTFRNEGRRADPLFFTLLETHGYPYSMMGDIVYDVLFRKLPYKWATMDPTLFTENLKCYLTESRLSDVTGALRGNIILNNDDQIAFRFSGLAGSHPLAALTYFADGIPLGFTNGVDGCFNLYKRLNELRKRYTALRSGSADYSSEGPVLIIRRILSDDPSASVTGLLNFSHERQIVTVSSPVANCKDVFSGTLEGSAAVAPAGAGQVSVTLPPFGIALLARPLHNEDTKSAQAELPKITAGNAVPKRESQWSSDNYGQLTKLSVIEGDGIQRRILGKTELLFASGMERPAKPFSVSRRKSLDGNETLTVSDSAGKTVWEWQLGTAADSQTLEFALPQGTALLMEVSDIKADTSSRRYGWEDGSATLRSNSDDERPVNVKVNAGGVFWQDEFRMKWARHANLTPSFGRSVFRLPQDDALMFDSTLIPPGPFTQELTIGQDEMQFIGNHVKYKVYRKFDGVPGLFVLLEGNGRMTLRLDSRTHVAKLPQNRWSSNGVTIVDAGASFHIATGRYKAVVSKCGGMIDSFSNDNTPALTQCDLVFKGTNLELHACNDYECRMQWDWSSKEGCILRTEGELRSALGNCEKLPFRVSTEYVFTKDAIRAKYTVWSVAQGSPESELSLQYKAEKKQTALVLKKGGAFLPGRSVSAEVEWAIGQEPVLKKLQETDVLRPASAFNGFDRLMEWQTLEGSRRHQIRELTGMDGICMFYRSFPVVHDGQCVYEMRFPDPILIEPLPVNSLSAGEKWRLVVKYSSKDLQGEFRRFRMSAWKDNWQKQGRMSLGFKVFLNWTDMSGNAIKLETAMPVAAGNDVKTASWTFDVPSGGIAPWIRLACPGIDPDSRLRIHSIQLEKVQQPQ